MILKYEAIKVLEDKSATNLGVDKDLIPPTTYQLKQHFLNRLEEYCRCQSDDPNREVFAVLVQQWKCKMWKKGIW